MKLRPLAIVVFLLSPNHCGVLLSPSPPHSVSNHKKTSLSGWLHSSSPSSRLASPLCSGPRPLLHSHILPQLDYSNSK